jgi:hypothetical protein
LPKNYTNQLRIFFSKRLGLRRKPRVAEESNLLQDIGFSPIGGSPGVDAMVRAPTGPEFA